MALVYSLRYTGSSVRGKIIRMIRAVSLFCGIGGWDIGLYRAAAELGIKVEVVAAYDSWPKAVEVYNANLPHPVAEVRHSEFRSRWLGRRRILRDSARSLGIKRNPGQSLAGALPLSEGARLFYPPASAT
jgi:C-5 cytosine-specific DNA methylase